jgi:hypothetical protein
MKRFVVTACFLLIIFITPAAASNGVDKFVYQFFDVCVEFMQSDDVIRRVRSVEGEELSQEERETVEDFVAYYQGFNSIALERETGPEGIYIYFHTKDKSLKFPGDLKIGADISTILKTGVIPGRPDKETTSNGDLFYAWAGDEYIFAITATEEGKIKQISFLNETEYAKITYDRNLSGYRNSDFVPIE